MPAIPPAMASRMRADMTNRTTIAEPSGLMRFDEGWRGGLREVLTVKAEEGIEMTRYFMNRVRTGALVAAALALGLVLSAGATPAAAQGTAQQRDACQGDAFRLCSQYIPNSQTTAACLYRAKRQLSPACREVMYGKATVSKKKYGKKRTAKRKKARRRR
jgi:uncharacterized membrane protein